MINRRHLISVAAFAVMAVVSSVAIADVIIDNFDEAPQGFQVNPFPGTTAVGDIGQDLALGIAPTNTIGGSRFLHLEITSILDPNTRSTLQVSNSGNLILADDPSVESTTTVVWDANGAGLGGIDLTDGDSLTHLFASVISQDLAAMLNFEFTTATGLLSGSTPAALGNNYLAFDDLLGPGNLNSVTGIKLTITGSSSLDLIIDLISATTVPEPIGMSIWAVALSAGFVGMRRRRKK